VIQGMTTKILGKKEYQESVDFKKGLQIQTKEKNQEEDEKE